MKKFFTVLMAFVMSFSALALTGCDGQNKPDIIEQDNPYEWIEANDKYNDAGYNNLNMVSVDEYGRVSLTAVDDKDDKEVGMFYHVAQGFHYTRGIYDVEKIIAEYGQDAVFKEASKISPNNQEHYWGEPLYGYYKSDDIYMIRKQVELFITCGIDYLVLDVTNGWIYVEATEKLMQVICELREDGWDAPQVLFYVHSLNNKTVREIYKEYYTDRAQYSDSWYMRDGKPVIIAYDDTAKDIAEAKTRGVTDFSDGTYADLSQEILDFFYFVEPRWPSDGAGWLADEPIFDKVNENGNLEGYAWIEWKDVLPVRETSLGTYMNVAVASHPSIPFSFSLTRGARNWARYYNPLTGHDEADGEYLGSYYQGCWTQAIEKSPDTLMLVLWNGWTALKQLYDGEYMMCDTCNFEYSLTIEPANGYYKDAYLLQTIQNVRKYKYVDGVQEHEANTIDINGTYAQWYNVDAVYRQIGKEVYGRDSYSSDNKTYHYVQDPADNNIQEIRTVHDKDNIYMMVRCGNNITQQNGSNWMNIFISAGSPELKGWNGYEYVINRQSIVDGKTVIEKLNSDYTGTACGEADIVIRDNFMFLKIPKAAVGMTDTNTFYFKAADSVAQADDMMSYYTTGSVFPVGRYSYSYTGK